MALPHIPAGEIFSVQPLAAQLANAKSHTLVRDAGLQIFRLVLRSGKTLDTHQVPERLIIQCIEGVLIFETMGRRLTMHPGDLCHIPCGEPHAVHAQEDSSALVFLFSPGVQSDSVEQRL